MRACTPTPLEAHAIILAPSCVQTRNNAQACTRSHTPTHTNTHLYTHIPTRAHHELARTRGCVRAQLTPCAPCCHPPYCSWQSAAFEAVSQKRSYVLSPPEIYAEIAHHGEAGTRAPPAHVASFVCGTFVLDEAHAVLDLTRRQNASAKPQGPCQPELPRC